MKLNQIKYSASVIESVNELVMSSVLNSIKNSIDASYVASLSVRASVWFYISNSDNLIIQQRSMNEQA